MIDFDKFSIFSVLGKDVAKMTEQEYIRLILEKYDKCLQEIREGLDKKYGLDMLKQTINLNTADSAEIGEHI